MPRSEEDSGSSFSLPLTWSSHSSIRASGPLQHSIETASRFCRGRCFSEVKTNKHRGVPLSSLRGQVFKRRVAFLPSDDLSKVYPRLTGDYVLSVSLIDCLSLPIASYGDEPGPMRSRGGLNILHFSRTPGFFWLPLLYRRAAVFTALFRLHVSGSVRRSIAVHFPSFGGACRVY